MITFVTLCWIILLLSFLHIFLLQLSAEWQRWTPPDASTLFGLVSFGGVSFATFWLYYFSHTAGSIFVAVLEIFAVARFAKCLFSSNGFSRYKQLNAHLLPVTSAALLILFIGLYPFGADWDSQTVLGNRWYKNLPMDNWLPKILADQVWEGSIKRPMVGDWLASDRPPLQAGAYLLVKYFSPETAGIYQVLGTWLQCTVIVPVILIVQSAGFGRKIAPLAVLTLSTCAVFIINGLFVWPKLLAATYTAVLFVALFQSTQTRLTPRSQILLAGLSLAFAMLSHSASSFALIGVLMAYVLQQRSKGLPSLFAACGIAVIAYLPWLVYQKIIDPPGDRLMKWHLAGVIPIDHRSLLQTLGDSYSSLTWETWLAGRIENVTRVFVDPLWFPRELSAYLQSIFHGTPDPSSIYVNSFFFFSYAQWFFPPAIILLSYAYLAVRRIRPPDTLNSLAGTVLFSLSAWVLLMFSPGSTIIHSGAYFCPIGALLLAMGLLNACSETVFKVLSWLSVSLAVSIYMLDRQIQALFVGGIAQIDLDYVLLLAMAFLFHYQACRLTSRYVSTIAVFPVPAGYPTITSSVVK